MDDVFPADLPNNIMDDTHVDLIEDGSCDLIDYLFENDSQVMTESSALLRQLRMLFTTSEMMKVCMMMMMWISLMGVL